MQVQDIVGDGGLTTAGTRHLVCPKPGCLLTMPLEQVQNIVGDGGSITDERRKMLDDLAQRMGLQKVRATG